MKYTLKNYFKLGTMTQKHYDEIISTGINPHKWIVDTHIESFITESITYKLRHINICATLIITL